MPKTRRNAAAKLFLTALAGLSLVACQHPAAPAAAAPVAVPVTLKPRLPVHHGRTRVIPAAENPELQGDDERFALAILERHPCGLSKALVRETAKTIVAESRANDLDPYLVLALIRVESTNWNWSRSEAGARGLMQVLPGTARHLSARAHVKWRGADSLYDPKVNVRLGTKYLAELAKRFGSVERALVAYNEGPTRLARQLRRHPRGAADADHDPNAYATKIVWFAERYHAIVANADSIAPGIARVRLALDQVEEDIDGRPAVALAHARRARAAEKHARRIDLNRVTFADLLTIDDGMTPGAARAIVDWRAANGGYQSLGELDEIGIDPGLARRLRTRVQVRGEVRAIVAAGGDGDGEGLVESARR